MTHDTAARLPAPALPDWINRELPFEQRYLVDVGGLRMHVMDSGHGRPVLMLHGNPTWGFLYRKVARELQTEPLRLLAPDLIGLGFSDHPPARAHSLPAHAAWVASLVTQLDLRDVVLVVQDWGGAIGLLAFATMLERVTGLVVLNTVLSEPKPGFRPTLFHRVAALPGVGEAVFRAGGFPQNALRFAQGDKRSIRGAAARAYRYPLRWGRGRAAPLALARLVPDSMRHVSIPSLITVRETVQKYHGAAAIVWGERDPILGSVRGWMRKLLPHASYTGTPAGHFLQEEVPVEIARAVLEVAGRDALA